MIEMMKALTVWQPWASLMTIGAKEFETRGWPTNYRGKIAIHAAAKPPREAMRGLPHDVQKAIFDSLYAEYGAQSGVLELLPTGAVVAIADLVNVWRTCYHPGANINRAMHIKIGAESMTLDKHDPDFDKIVVPSEREMLLGDWTPVRYAWQLANVKALEKPIPVKGKQGLWNWEVSA
jgi:hypothetical protein